MAEHQAAAATPRTSMSTTRDSEGPLMHVTETNTTDTTATETGEARAQRIEPKAHKSEKRNASKSLETTERNAVTKPVADHLDETPHLTADERGQLALDDNPEGK